MITDTEGNRLTVIGWTDGARDSRVGIHRLGVGAVLTLNIEAARELAEDLTRWVGMVRRAAAELADDEPIGTAYLREGFCGLSPAARNRARRLWPAQHRLAQRKPLGSNRKEHEMMTTTDETLADLRDYLMMLGNNADDWWEDRAHECILLAAAHVRKFLTGQQVRDVLNEASQRLDDPFERERYLQEVHEMDDQVIAEVQADRDDLAACDARWVARKAELARQQQKDASLTREHVMADLAAGALEKLSQIDRDLNSLRSYLFLLAALMDRAQYADDLVNGVIDLGHAMEATRKAFECEIAEAVRDVAQTLPVRGIDYGVQ